MAKIGGWLQLIAVVGAGYLLFSRPRPLSRPVAQPAGSYAEAMRRVNALQASDGPEIKALCRSIALTHGDAVDTAVVLLHGYSSSPHQYHILAQQLFEQGNNVVVPRYPYHGHVSRTYEDFWRMPLPDVVETVSEAIDIAQGLGTRVVVMGLSFGGALAAWMAQYRSDIDHAVIVSPALGFRSVAGWLRRPAALLTRLARPRQTWWDADRREAGGVFHAYAGWNTRGAAEMMRLGMLLSVQSRTLPPAARAVTIVINPADRLLDLDPIHRLANNWQRLGANVELHSFPEAWGLRHDLIEPEAENAQIDRVYPVLQELAGRA